MVKLDDNKNSKNIVPWLPEKNFWEDNLASINDIFELIAHHYPDIAVPKITDSESTHPSAETREWMWTRLMGHQHGSQLGFGNKVPMTRADEHIFRPKVAELHFGPYNFVLPARNQGDAYDKAFILGGTPPENTNRLTSVLGESPLEGNVNEVVILAGQRQRWDTAGEATIPEIYAAISRYSGADFDKLRQLSPFIREEEDRKDDPKDKWNRPYSTEWELARLTVEAVFRDAIDWNEYPVDTSYDTDANPLAYQFEGSTKYTPAREVALVTYHLKDGRKVHVLNGKAVLRKQGEGAFPKPTSDSTTREAIKYVGIKDGESIVIGTSVPHVRAGLDALIRILDLRKNAIKNAHIVSGPWEKEKELLAALGEVPATYKADQRLRAVLNDTNPDSSVLKKL